jgi:hypothetical protein
MVRAVRRESMEVTPQEDEHLINKLESGVGSFVTPGVEAIVQMNFL